MCQSIADGGLRCAAHTRPAYQTAEFGTSAWDAAAAAYASTPTGRVELAGSLAAAEAAGDIRSAVAFEHAIAEGARLRERAAAVRDALTAEPASEPGPAIPVEIPVEIPGVEEFEGDLDGHWDEEAWEDTATMLARNETPPSGDYGDRTMGWWPDDEPAFEGIPVGSVNQDEFIDAVCANVQVSRAEFETAVAEYLYRRVPADAFVTGVANYPQAGVANLATHMAQGTAVPLSPEQISVFAHRARAAAQTGAAQAQHRGAPVLGSAFAADARQALIRQARAEDADPDFLDRLARDPDDLPLAAAAARNPNLPAHTLLELASSRRATLRAGAARNPRLPVEHINRLSEDSSVRVRGMVARNPSTPATVYARLMGDASAQVRADAARRNPLPEGAASVLISDQDNSVLGALARNRSIDAHALRRLGYHPSTSVRAHAVRNPRVSRSILVTAAVDPSPSVRAAAARNPNTRPQSLGGLAVDSDPWVRRNVAWNEATPATVLLRLARDPQPEVRAAVGSRRGHSTFGG